MSRRSILLILTNFILIFIHFTKAIIKENKNYDEKLHWLFFHYHKTGNEFSALISSAFSERCNAKLGHFTEKRMNSMKETFFPSENNELIYNNDLILIVPGSFTEDWNNTFSLLPHHHYRILHMVRDPTEMILSAYRYHSQSPPPEVWIWN
jgi:hypothetical protein